MEDEKEQIKKLLEEAGLPDWLADKNGKLLLGRIVKYYREKKVYIDSDGTQRQWTQKILAKSLKLQEHTVQLMETKNQSLNSIERRQALVEILGIPPILLGLSDLTVVETLKKLAPTEIEAPDILTSKRSGISQDVIAGYQDALAIYNGLYTDRTIRAAIGGIEHLIAQITSDIQNARLSQKTILQHILWNFHRLAGQVYGYDLGNWQQAHNHIKEGLELAMILDSSDLKARGLYLSTNLQLILFNKPLQVMAELDGALQYAKSATAPTKGAITALAAGIHARVATDYATRLKAEKLLEEAEKGLNVSWESISMKFSTTHYLNERAGTLIDLGKYSEALEAIDDGENFALHKRELENANILRAQCYIKQKKPELEQAVLLLGNVLEQNKAAKEQSHLKKVERCFNLLATGKYAHHPDTVQLGLTLRELQKR